jgi:hypothetical protein
MVIAIDFFAQMNMRGDGMFEKLRQQITEQQQGHRENKSFGIRSAFFWGLPERYRLGKNFNEIHRQHKTGAEREQVFQIRFKAILNTFRKKNQAAENIGESSKIPSKRSSIKLNFIKTKL